MPQISWHVTNASYPGNMVYGNELQGKIFGMCDHSAYTLNITAESGKTTFAYNLTLDSRLAYQSAHNLNTENVIVQVLDSVIGSVCRPNEAECCTNFLEVAVDSESADWNIVSQGSLKEVVMSGQGGNTFGFICNGDYNFTISDENMCCNSYSGSYSLALNRRVVYNSGGDFDHSESLNVTIPKDNTHTAEVDIRQMSSKKNPFWCNQKFELDLTETDNVTWQLSGGWDNMHVEGTVYQVAFWDLCPGTYDLNAQATNISVVVNSVVLGWDGSLHSGSSVSVKFSIDIYGSADIIHDGPSSTDPHGAGMPWIQVFGICILIVVILFLVGFGVRWFLQKRGGSGYQVVAH